MAGICDQPPQLTAAWLVLAASCAGAAARGAVAARCDAAEVAGGAILTGEAPARAISRR
jgi:hypothetical protein